MSELRSIQEQIEETIDDARCELVREDLLIFLGWLYGKAATEIEAYKAYLAEQEATA